MTKVSTSGWAWTIGGALAAGVSALALGAGYLWWQQQGRPAPLPQIEVTDTPATSQADTTAGLAASDPAAVADAVPDPEAEPETAVTAERDGASDAAPAEAAASGASTDAPEATGLSAPVLDVVRVETDGSALVAGSGQTGSVVIVLLDETEVSRAEIGPDGEFVIFMPVPPGETAQVLSLRAELNGEARASEESFILAPVAAAPTQVAELTTDRETAEGDTPVANDAPVADADGGASVPLVTETAEAVREDAKETVEALADIASGTVSTDGQTDQTSALEETTVADIEDGNVATTEGANAAAQVVNQAASTPTQTASNTSSEPAPVAAEPVGETAKVATEAAVESALAGGQPTDASTQAAPLETTLEAPVAAGQDVPAAATAAETGTQIAVLKADETGLSLVQPAAPAAPELVGKVVLDTISYTPAGEVLLKGRSRPEALVRVYLDNAPVAEIASAGDGSWDAELLDVVPGIYTLRLDEIEPTVGRVLSRIETPFKRETPEVLAQSGAVDAGQDGAPVRPRLQAVTVQQGDTLWAISDTVYGDGLLFVRVFEANRDLIRNPDLIYPGQIFNLPE